MRLHSFYVKRYTTAIYFVIVLCAALFNNAETYAQCPVEAFANPMNIQCGDTVILSAAAEGCKPLNNNFNTGVIGTDWAATNGAVVTNGSNLPNATYNCVGTPPEGPFCLWMGASVAAPRQVKTNNYNLLQCSAIGGNICFLMKFSTQGGPDPCEGIDLPEEGVALEYSINNGATWVTIQYYDPNGGYDPVRTTWTQYCVPIPAAAMTANTQFRWYQANSSGAGFDTWGLDDMVINLISPGYTFDWAHDNQAPNPLPNTPNVAPGNTTTYTVTYTNGVESCSSSVTVNVTLPTSTASASPATICAGNTSQLNVVTSLTPPIPANCGASVTGCQGTTAGFTVAGANVNESSYAPLGVAQAGGCTALTVNGACTGNCDNTARVQMIINQNELPAYFPGGQFYSMTLHPINLTVGAQGSGLIYNISPGSRNGFTVRMQCTNKTEFTSNTDFVNANWTTVFTPKTVSVANNVPLNLDFDQHFDYTGTGNILVEFSWTQGSGNGSYCTGNLMKTATPNFSTIFAHGCGANGNTNVDNAARYQFRPKVGFGVCYRIPPVLQYTWSPTTGLSNPNISNPVATVNNTTTYTVTVSDAFRPQCVVNSNVTVTVGEPTLSFTPANPNVCASGGSVSITANALPSQPGGSIVSYAWSPATGLSSTNTQTVTASPTATTTYTVTVTDNTGCTRTSTVTVTVGQPAGPTAVHGQRCGTGSVSLAVTGCGGTVRWYDASTGGNLLFTGNPFNTPSISSNTTYYATCTVSGCESARTAVTATINSAPNAAFSYSPNSICKTGSPLAPTVTGTSGTFTASPSGLTINSSNGTVTPSSSTVGSYTVTNTVAATPGCPSASATAAITISAPPTANFQYNGPYCQSAANPTPTLIGGAQAGTFSAPAGLVFVSTSSGQVNLSASTPGTYTVTNTIPAQNGCAAVSATASITINPANSSAFNYASNSYCKSGTNPSANITGANGGTFTASPSGLVFANSSTGLIDLTASQVGSYTITYTSPNPCSTTSTFSLSITNNPAANFAYPSNPYCASGANASPVFNSGGIPGNFTASPAGLVFVSASTGVVNVSASTPGTYTVTNTVNSAGCAPASATANITINTPPQSGFSYAQNAYCKNQTNPAVILNAGASSGTFSATPAGLVFSGSNGTINLAASTANTYTVTNTVNGTGNCPNSSSTFTVTVNANTSAAFAYGSGTYCTGASNPSPTISGTSGGTFSSTPAGLVFADAVGTIDLTGSSAGSYTITYSVGGPCPSTSSVSVNISSSSAADFSYAGPYCLNEPNPSPTFQNGGTPGTFTASPAGLVFANNGTGEVNLSSSSPGTYTVTNTIGGASGCPNVSFSNSITLNPTDDASFNYSALAYCSSSDPTVTPTITGTPGGFFGSSTGLVINASNGQIDVFNSTQGTYTVSYSTSGSCPAQSDQLVEIYHQLSPDFNFTGNPYCVTAGSAVPQMINGGVAGTWSGIGVVFSNVTTGEVDLAATGVGTYTVRNSHPANGACPAVFQDRTLTISSEPTANFSYPGSPYCQTATDPVAVLAPGATAGNFTASSANLVITNASNGTVDLSASIPGTYTVTNSVPANGGCPAASFNAIIEVNGPVNGDFSYPSSPYCNSGADATVQIAAGSIAGNFFSNQSGIIVNSSTGSVDVSATTPGTYKVYNEVNPNNACPVHLDSANLTISAQPVADFDFNPQYCQSEPNPSPTFINGGTAGSFFSTSGLVFVSSSTGQINLSASTPGNYTITNTVPASNGCPAVSASDNIAIVANDDPGFGYSQDVYCSSASDPTPAISGVSGGTFSATPGGLVYNTSSGTIDLDQSLETVYNITYTTPGVCPSDSTIQLEIIDLPNAEFQYIPNVYCQNDPDPLPQFPSGGSAGTFTAVPSGLVWIDNTTGQIDLSASNPSNYNVTNTIAPANGCPGASFTTVVTINGIPDAEFYYTEDSLCNNDAQTFVPQHNTGVNGIYSAAPAGLSINASNGSINIPNSSPGTYQIRNVVLGSGSCPNDTAYFTFTVKAMPTVNPSSDAPICAGETLNLQVITAPNSPGTTYSWTGPNAFISNIQNPSIPNAPSAASGNYTIQITTLGCTSFDILTGVVVTPSSPTNFGPAGPYCPDEAPVQLTNTNPGGTWTGTGVSSNGVFSPSVGSGTYMITYTNNNDCTLDSVQVVVNQKPAPVISFDDDFGCLPHRVNFNAQGTQLGDNIQWNLGDGATQNGNFQTASAFPHTYTTPGCFDLTLTVTRTGCTTTVTATDTICTVASPIANFEISPNKADVSFPQFQLINLSQNATIYNWQFPDNSFSSANAPVVYLENLTSGEYTIVLVANNSGDCPDTAYRFITLTEDLIYFIPNSFTPDDDKFNPTFRPVISSGIDPKSYVFQVYDRWGEKIFETSDPEIGWDGTFNNKVCAQGVYTWKLSFANRKTGEAIVKVGQVNLLK